MAERQIPLSVIRARMSSDYTSLSRLGRKGAETRKKKKEDRKEKMMLRGALEAMVEAHLDICPIDD